MEREGQEPGALRGQRPRGKDGGINLQKMVERRKGRKNDRGEAVPIKVVPKAGLEPARPCDH